MDDQGEVTTIEELEAFLTRVGRFHDGVIKEVHWVNFDFVRPDLSMMPYRGSCARVLVQRQWENPSAVELRFAGIMYANLDTRDFVFDSGGQKLADGFLSLQIENSEFVFRKMSYRFVSEWMGEELRFGSELPYEALPHGEFVDWRTEPQA